MLRLARLAGAAALFAAASGATRADDTPFPDVNRDKMHWAYEAVDRLAQKKILLGYPDGYFRGRRTLTRYEFGTALDRILRSMPVPPGLPGDPGPMGAPGRRGEPGPVGERGMAGFTPEEVQQFRRLTDEFRSELGALGNSWSAVNRKIDGVERAINDIRADLSRMPKFYGGFFTGIRSDRADGGYVDYSGRPLNSAGSGSLVSTPIVVNDFGFGVRANIAGGAKLDAMISANNYTNFLGGTIGHFMPYNLRPDTDVFIHHAFITTPFSGIGRKGSITIGRFGEKLGPLVLSRPDVDPYFRDPLLDGGYEGRMEQFRERYPDRRREDGQVHSEGHRDSGSDFRGHDMYQYGGGDWGKSYYLDGVKLGFDLGSVRTNIFAGQTKSVTGSNGQPWNSPRAGISINPPIGEQIFNNNFKPTDQPFLGQLQVDQLAGLDLKVPFSIADRRGSLQLGALALTGESPFGATGPTNTLVPWLRFGYSLCDHSNLSMRWSKSITGRGRFDTQNAYDNNAWEADLGYRSGPFHADAGYQYIDPRFSAPGYWNKIGNWYNPTNIQGPNFRFGYDATPSFQIHVGGDFLSPARNRAGVGSLGGDDEINRIRTGLRWDLSKSVRATVDWEAVYWKLAGTHSGIPALGNGTIHPTEHYITLGTGYNLTSNTQLRFLYQMGDFDGHGSLNGGAGTKYNFNVFTSQVSVRF